MPFGKGSLKSAWIADDLNRHFDLVLLAYHPLATLDIVSGPNVKIFEYKDYKWWMVQDFFRDHAEYLKSYDSFFFLDDDIEISGSQINTLLEYFNRSPLQLAQPSLTHDSFMSWKALRNKSWSTLRYMTTVELMCPLMKRGALRYLLPTFKLTKSGWGVDLLWGKMVNKKFGRKKIAVIDLIQVRHTKPVGKGELYTRLEQPPKVEEDQIRKQYKLEKFRIKEVKCIENFFLCRVLKYIQVKVM